MAALDVSRCCIDHIVVAAPSLEAGSAMVREALGVSPQAGGNHTRMGTHNLLVRLGDMSYLEIIAADPTAPAPSRPRWFGLDALDPRSPAALTAWVARTWDIRAAAAASSESLGNIESMSRGRFSWRITIPSDGSLPLDGAAPALIEWQADEHPAAQLEDQGLSLSGLELFHSEPARISRLLVSLNLEGPFSVFPISGVARPRLVARFNTPLGVRVLSAPQC